MRQNLTKLRGWQKLHPAPISQTRESDCLPHRFRSNNKNLLFVVQHRFISKQQDPQPTLTMETQEPYGKECLAAQPRGYLRFGSTTTSV